MTRINDLAAWWNALALPLRLAVVAWVVVVLFLGGRFAASPRHASYTKTWGAAGAAWLEGGDTYPPHGGPAVIGYRYSPPVSVCFVGMAVPPAAVARPAWLLLGAAALLAGMTWWRRVAFADAADEGEWAFTLLLVLVMAVSSFANGQANPLLAGLVLAGTAAFLGGRMTLAAALFAAATWLKVYPLALALLLVLVRPRAFAPRLAVALVLVGAVPFLFQAPGYVVRQYQLWWGLIGTGDLDRLDWPLEWVYRDLRLLFRIWNVPVGTTGYAALQLLSAAGCAAFVLLGRRRGAPPDRLARDAVVLGLWWMMLLGPATESKTYVLVAPVLAWWAVHVHRHGAAGPRNLAVIAVALQLICALGAATPAGNKLYHCSGLHPLSMILLAWSYLWAVRPGAALAVRLAPAAPRPARAAPRPARAA